jgi:hypothetical protein
MKETGFVEFRSFRAVDEQTYATEVKRLMKRSAEARSDVYIVWPGSELYNLKLRYGQFLELKTRTARHEETGMEGLPVFYCFVFDSLFFWISFHSIKPNSNDERTQNKRNSCPVVWEWKQRSD